MGSLWRSEEMTLAQLFLQSEAAFECVSALGELGLVQFVDLNEEVNAYNRKYVNEMRRCDEMARKLRYFEKEIVKAGMEIDGPGNAAADPAPDTAAMQNMETEFTRLESELVEINSNTEALQTQELELKEMKEILVKTSQFFEQTDMSQVTEQAQDPARNQASALLGPQKDDRAGALGFVAGIIKREKTLAFERLTWRACRGNVFIRMFPMETAKDAEKKDSFIIYFQGTQLQSRVEKICDGFNAKLYPCPDTHVERREMGVEVDTRLADLQNILTTTSEHLRKNLSRIARQLAAWQVKVTKIKAIYHTMNKFNYDSARTSLLGEVWCPRNQLGTIREALRAGAERSGTGAQPILTPMKTKKEHPTYHVTNKFTSAFQNIVDAYGVAKYQEVNPGPFTIITFPFLFAVMFGDIGHGLIMFLFAFFLVRKENSLSKIKGGGEIWDTIFGGRYIVLLMGMFSIYTGFIYNDCFSKSMTIVDSGWELPNPAYVGEQTISLLRLREDQLEQKCVDFYTSDPPPKTSYQYLFCEDNPELVCYPHNSRSLEAAGCNSSTASQCFLAFNLTEFCGNATCVTPPAAEVGGLCKTFARYECESFGCFKYAYPLGIDPLWISATNALTFTNSYKMKMSVILGFLQMTFGVILSYFNASYFKRSVSVYHEFLPQIFFLVGIFGYLCIMIIMKWIKAPENFPSPNSSPQIMVLLIQMFLSPGSLSDSSQVMFGSEKGTEQKMIQLVLVIVALVCVPWMLLVKPFKLKAQWAKEKLAKEAHQGNDDEEEEDNEEHHDFSEVMVHQAIHTIEFCLGCISNTASYLRLWALSLAHAQLSEVLWEQVLENCFHQEGAIGAIAIFLGFGAWAVMTIAVLLIMEGLSAFLHALRLHWVEFQNKFYDGTGYLFKPFSFLLIISGEDDDPNMSTK
eukprot:m.53106 g.53106  ORF g.53106 m.53106 type:complete len:915 (+) comp21710_c1_seq1:65-2809(+)